MAMADRRNSSGGVPEEGLDEENSAFRHDGEGSPRDDEVASPNAFHPHGTQAGASTSGTPTLSGAAARTLIQYRALMRADHERELRQQNEEQRRRAIEMALKRRVVASSKQSGGRHDTPAATPEHSGASGTLDVGALSSKHKASTVHKYFHATLSRWDPDPTRPKPAPVVQVASNAQCACIACNLGLPHKASVTHRPPRVVPSVRPGSAAAQLNSVREHVTSLSRPASGLRERREERRQLAAVNATAAEAPAGGTVTSPRAAHGTLANSGLQTQKPGGADAESSSSVSEAMDPDELLRLRSKLTKFRAVFQAIAQDRPDSEPSDPLTHLVGRPRAHYKTLQDQQRRLDRRERSAARFWMKAADFR